MTQLTKFGVNRNSRAKLPSVFIQSLQLVTALQKVSLPMLSLLICSNPVKGQHHNERSQGVAGSRPVAPLGPPASVRLRVHQLTDPLLRPAPPEGSRRPAGRVAEASARGPVPIWAGWKSPEWRPGRGPDGVATKSSLAHEVRPAGSSRWYSCRVLRDPPRGARR